MLGVAEGSSGNFNPEHMITVTVATSDKGVYRLLLLLTQLFGDNYFLPVGKM